MRQLLMIITLLNFTSDLWGQTKEIKIDTFSASQWPMYSRLLLCNDSTFFIITGGCVDAGISKGKWLKSKNKILLNGLSKCETELKVSLASQSFDNDSLATFTFHDLFSNPFTAYTVIFFDTSFHETRLVTDAEGKIKTKRGQFVAFYTQNEEQNVKVGDAVNDKVHFLWEKLTRYQVSINYPTSVLTDRGITEIYQFTNRQFTVQGKNLIDAKNKIVYKSN
ncbi:MAG: hypothetical protein ABI691_00950 [Ginsengibacter sp.]